MSKDLEKGDVNKLGVDDIQKYGNGVQIGKGRIMECIICFLDFFSLFNFPHSFFFVNYG